MAMNIGDEACTSGLSKEIYDKRVSELPGGALPSGFDPTYMKKQCYADAYAYVNHWKTNMEIGGVSSEIDASHLATDAILGTGVGAWPGAGCTLGTLLPASSIKEVQTGTVHPT
jgi:hypothetical protein